MEKYYDKIKKLTIDFLKQKGIVWDGTMTILVDAEHKSSKNMSAEDIYNNIWFKANLEFVNKHKTVPCNLSIGNTYLFIEYKDKCVMFDTEYMEFVFAKLPADEQLEYLTYAVEDSISAYNSLSEELEEIDENGEQFAEQSYQEIDEMRAKQERLREFIRKYKNMAIKKL